jgi:GT2 family glycosyltransferase
LDLVSIGIVTYLDNENLEALLEALVVQSRKDFLVSVIDAANDPECEGLVERFNSSGLQISYEKSSSNNLAENRQILLSNAKTKWLLFLDSDCKPTTSSWLEEFVQVLSSVETDTLVVGGGYKPHFLGSSIGVEAVFSSRLFNLGSPQVISSLEGEFVDHVPMGCAALKVDSVLKIGGFDRDFDLVGEDLDLGLRINGHGYRVYLLSKLKVEHVTNLAFSKWSRRMLKFGYAQRATLRSDKSKIGPKSRAFWVLAFISYWILAFLFGKLFLAASTYLLVVLLVSSWLAKKQGFIEVVRACLFMITSHFFYAAGFVLPRRVISRLI